jgi:hypothetical protein
MFFQQDRSTQSSHEARNDLYIRFSEHLTGRDGPMPWTPRSPELSLLEFFCGDLQKDLDYIENPRFI